MKLLKKMAAGAAVAATAVAGTVVLASPSSAAVVTGPCWLRGPFCLYYNSVPYGLGAEFGADEDIPSFNPTYGTGDIYEFTAGVNGSAGAGWSVWNQAAAASNKDFDYNFALYANHGYAGASETIPAGSGPRNLTITHNNDTSLKWF